MVISTAHLCGLLGWEGSGRCPAGPSSRRDGGVCLCFYVFVVLRSPDSVRVLFVLLPQEASVSKWKEGYQRWCVLECGKHGVLLPTHPLAMYWEVFSTCETF